MVTYILTVEVEEEELDYLCEAIEQAGGFIESERKI